jgi:PAS domain S-box-containing protein
LFWSSARDTLNATPARSRFLACVVLTVTYVIAGRLGLFLAGPPGYATAIFPPAGIAMAAMFIGGSITLPWTFFGSFLLNLWIGNDIQSRLDALALAAALVIASASMLQAAIGGWTLRRLIGYPTTLDTGRDLAKFFLGSPVLCLTSATLSLSGLAALGVVNAPEVVPGWLTWWMGDTLGVLLFLPFVMVVGGKPRAFWRTRALSVALPMFLFFMLFVAIFIQVNAWEIGESLVEFWLLSQQIIGRIGSRIGIQEVFLEQVSASFSGPTHLSRHDFSTLTQNLLRRYPFIQAIEWAPHIEATHRDEFEAAQRRDHSGFGIAERDEAGRLHRANDRPDFYPVTYLEPLRGNELALNFDLASDPARRAAILHTIDTGTVTATTPIRLVQEPTDETGILLMSAVRQGDNGPGIVLIALRMGAYLDALLGPANKAIGVKLVDQETNQPLFDTLPSRPLHERTITFGGRTYLVQTAPTTSYFSEHRRWQSAAVLMIGVLGTSLLGALLMLSSGERQRFARLLTERTRERDRIWQVSEDLLGVGNFEGYFISVNPAWTRTLGWSEDEIKTLHVNELRHPDDAPVAIEGRRRLADGTGTVRMENRFRHKEGSYRWIYWTMTAEQGLIYLVGRNVTADKAAAQVHRQTEEQLHQLQKLDSVGQLTGGIAHDFNNLLTVVIGNLEILGRLFGTTSARVTRAVTAAMTGATRAATLTQRLLAYAQKQPLRPQAVSLNELVTGMADLIRRTQGETIVYEFALGENLPLCFCDANQVETSLLNLVINARDAMPCGGRLKIETSQIVFDGGAADARGVAAGAYVMLAVSDTGFGMSRETAERAFEPFFTTKETGKGTGLGLSVVYGFVKQSRGLVEIDTANGCGTTVRIFLPRLAAGDTQRASGLEIESSMSIGARASGETILIAEDDASVRSYVVETLKELDYQVIEADGGIAALTKLSEPELQLDLLLTDVVMPGINGRELADRAKAMRPHIKILFMSGYSQDAIVHQGRLDPDIELIEKPFGSVTLAARVRSVLDADVI